jgi:hypothetical protein
MKTFVQMVAFFILVLLNTGLAEQTQTGTASSPIVVQNSYFAKAGKAKEVYRWRLNASDVREKLGLRRGRVLRRFGDSAHQPDVIWECDYPDMKSREAELKTLESNPEFDAVMEHMNTLLDRFDRAIWEVDPK